MRSVPTMCLNVLRSRVIVERAAVEEQGARGHRSGTFPPDLRGVTLRVAAPVIMLSEDITFGPFPFPSVERYEKALYVLVASSDNDG